MQTNIAAPKAAPPPRTSRMTLAGIISGPIARPIRAIMYGVEGVGKSTFAANAPAPIFLGAEDGTASLDVNRLPAPQNWQDVLDAAKLLETETHGFKTLVLDTLDWAEPLLWRFCCERDKQESIEAYGYGKGYVVALDGWRVFLAALERLRDRKGMNIILLAHSVIRPFKNPEGEDFDRYQMKLNEKAGGLIREWSDAVLFANFETFASKDKNTKRVRGVSTGARIIHTVRTAAFDAKNRHSLPETMPLDWDTFAAAVAAHRVASPETLIAEIKARAADIPDEKLRAVMLDTTEKAGENTDKLAQILNRINARLAEVIPAAA